MRCWILGSAMREQLAEVWRVFRRQRAAAGGFLALAVIVVASPSIVVLSRIDPEAISADVLGRPSLAHAMGTDYLGRDILGRVLHGVNTSLLVGASVAAIALAIGLVLGTTAGFYRGSIDHVIMRAADGLLIVPTFFLVLADVLALKEEAFVQSARALGAGDARLMFREILPNTLPPVVAMIALLGSSAILAEASLSFLGVGDPNVVSLGQMLTSGLEYVTNAWWVPGFPGAAIFVLVLLLNVLGDGLNVALNPRLR